MRGGCRRGVTAVLVLLAIVGAACSETRPGSTPTGQTKRNPFPGCERATVLACLPADTSIADFVPDQPTRATGTPIKIATINTDTGPAGAFPELTEADAAAVRFINAELGGVDGHPIELSRCDTQFSPERSNSCSQDAVAAGVVAVAGGIDVLGTGINILAENGIPYVGGIPVSTLAATSPVSFQFSGGIWGAVVAQVQYAITSQKAKRVSIIYGDFGAIADAAELGKRVGESLGAEVSLVSMPIVASDYLSPLTLANENNPDAIVALVADTGCAPVYEAVHDLGITANLFYTGACVAPKIIEAVGADKVEGSYFNVEGPVTGSAGQGTGDPDTTLYGYIVDKYGEGLEAQSSATVAFRGFMNLWVAMKEVGGDRLTPARLLEHLRRSKDHRSFMGHPYTCDGKQLPDQPAMCAPQEILVRYQDGAISAVTKWIDVPAIVAAA